MAGMFEPNGRPGQALVWGAGVALLAGVVGYYLGHHPRDIAAAPAMSDGTPGRGPDSGSTAPGTAFASSSAAASTDQRLATLQREYRRLETELNEQVLKAIREKESVSTTRPSNEQAAARQAALPQMIEQRARLASSAGDIQSRAEAARLAFDRGETPPEVEQQIRADPRYARERDRLDRIEAEMDALRARTDLDPTEAANLAADLSQRRAAAAARVDQAHAELRKSYGESVAASMQTELSAAVSGLAQLDEVLNLAADDLETADQLAAEIAKLRERERTLRDQMAALSNQMSRLRQGATP